jgi:fructokinase
MISRVGADEAGQQIIKQMADWGIITTACQVDPQYPTGEACPVFGDDHEVSYDLLFPAAWDFIDWESLHMPLISSATALVFGSLITRSQSSYQTLLRLLDQSAYNVLDVNLREPYYTPEIICTLLKKAQLLKVNQAELDLICSWIGDIPDEEPQKAAFLQDRFTLQEIVVTQGSRGASYYSGTKQVHADAPHVEVVDTVGSGDAFLAGFLAEKFRHPREIKRQLSMGCALGALIAAKSGACPAYSLHELHSLFDTLEPHI